MALEAGSHLGPYEILAAIGAGGMGEVYRARDTRLDRTVAIKVLPPDLAHDPERRQRFAREARAIASLTHPHICTLHEFDTEGAVDFLVMEHLEGETLARRLTRGPLPLAETLRLAIQIADALAAAHKRGIVHRDLKPGNIMLTGTAAAAGRTGTAQVKLLDFGLAKLRASGTGPVLASAPTASDPLTGAGTIVGTLQYMAPEQLEGREADARTDLFAFGAIVYEMLTGHRAFQGDSQASLIAAILEHEPAPLAERQPLTPPALERTVRRCLAKDPEDRWDGAHDVAEELRWIAAGGSSPMAAVPVHERTRGSGRRWLLVTAAALVGAAVSGIVVRQLMTDRAGPRPPVTRLELGVAPADHLGRAFAFGGQGADTIGGYRTALAFTSDGLRLVYTALRDGRRQLYVRNLTDATATPLADTDGARVPFTSPDGRWIGFWANGAIKKVPLDGGPTITLCAWPGLFGASWTKDDRIVLDGPTEKDGLWQLPAAGGTPEPLTTLDSRQFELSHRLPHALPGGRAIVHTVVHRSNASATTSAAALVAVELASGTRHRLIDNAADVRYVASGHLVFARDGALLAAPFDVERLAVTGEPVGLVSGVSQAVNVPNTVLNTLAAQFAVSNLGTLAYVAGGIVPGSERRLVWVDRQGTVAPLPAPLNEYLVPRLSPDGQRVVVAIRGKGLWLYDLARGTLTPFAPEPADFPLWTPQGTHVSFSRKALPYGLFRQRADGSGTPVPLTNHDGSPGSWTPDGHTLAYVRQGAIGSDIWLWSEGDHTRPLMETPFDEFYPAFAPDGRWLAFTSNESGRQEVYLQAHPGPGSKWQVSVEGGYGPAWAPNGRELFFRTPGVQGRRSMMVVDVRTQPLLRLGKPRALFSNMLSATTPIRDYDVSSDGRRFLMVEPIDRPAPPPVTHLNIVLNWVEELKEKVPSAR